MAFFSTTKGYENKVASVRKFYLFAFSLNQNRPQRLPGGKKAGEGPCVLAWVAEWPQVDTYPHNVPTLLCSEINDMI